MDIPWRPRRLRGGDDLTIPSTQTPLGNLLVATTDSAKTAAAMPPTNSTNATMSWADARAGHIERTRAHVESQLALPQDHAFSARTNPRGSARKRDARQHPAHAGVGAAIGGGRLRETLRSVEANIDRSEVTTSLLCSGVVEVVNGDELTFDAIC